MFRTKHEVDKHVENCLKKINSEKERNLRCFAFAKLYFKVGEYEQAHRYILNYLNAKHTSAEGQNWLGQILEKLGRKEASLEAYRTSLDLDPKQNNLVIKVCELLASDDVNLDKTWARYFCEKAQSFDPYNPVVFQLKEKLVSSESKDPYDVTNLLLKELETRPLDVDIRVRLLRHLMLYNKVKEAYTHVYEIEQKNISVFMNNLTWYETIAEVLMSYQKEVSNNLSWEFWMLFISVLDKLSTLSLDERSANIKNSTECTSAVFNFDQNMKVASENLKSCPEKQLVQEFLNHYTGQLNLHFVTLLYKQAKKDLIKYKEVAQICLPLLFAAYNFQPIDMQSMWVEHCSESHRQLVQRWHREAAFRCSQIGHMLLSTAKDKKSSTLDKANQSMTGMWREQVFKKVFITRDQQSKIKSSYFCLCSQLIDIGVVLPDHSELLKFDRTSQLVYPDSLHHYIWLGLNSKLSLLNCSVFHGLQYSIKNLNHCAAETLNILDIEAFIYCATLCAKSQIEENKQTIYYNTEKPSVLPASVTEQLGTMNQSKWLQAAYKLYKNQQCCEMGDIRLTLIRGIECIHCVGNHGLDAKLLVALAKIFAEKAKKLTKQSEIEFNEARAELYWKNALPLLEKLKRNQAVSFSTNRLFESKMKEMSHNEVVQSIDSGRLFIGCQLMKKKDYEKALSLFEALKDPYASFNQAQIYKLMADKELGQNKENVTSEMRSQHIILLTKSRDCLYLTLDRLRDPNVDRKHPLNEKLGTEIEKIERLLSRIDPDICVNRNECDGMSDENVSSIESENYNINSAYHSSYTNGNFTSRQDNHNVHSTPFRSEHSRREARPSPERLDAQLRQLAASKDAAINHVLEQNKVMVESHKSLVDELKNFRETVSGLVTTVNLLKEVKESVEDMKGIKKSVDELKTAVEELQSFRNISDLFYEMRKEISELKKDTSKIKSNQLSDEDLYALDEEYGGEYSNINSNTSGLTPSIYPNLGRLPPAPNTLAYPTPALYHGMYPMYPYPGLGLPQAGLPFGHESQLTDFRSMSSLSQGLNQQGLSQTGYLQPIPPPVQQPQPSSLVITSLPPTSFVQSPLAQLQQHTMSNFFKDSITAPTPVTTTSIFSSTINTAILTTSATSVTPSKPLPVNVVITNSDPLPSVKSVTTPQILSVTIPPQHLKSNQKAHNYQIPLPANANAISSTPSVLNQSPLPISTQSLLQNVAPPVYSAIADKTNKNASLGLQIEKSLSQSFNKSTNSDPNRSNVSSSSIDEHDPCPDFKPIIPLPDEVPVNTGEENEMILFCERAKLFRFTNKEWKERGIGDLKILKNRETGKVRILMRRDQVHKICANHYITEDINIMPMNNNEKAYIWAANDFADQEVVLEKFCVQFKTPDLSKKFYIEFEKARKSLSEGKAVQAEKTKTPTVSVSVVTTAVATTNLGGFKFTSTPTFKPKEEVIVSTTKVVTNETPKSNSPFASFTFGKDVTKTVDNKSAATTPIKPTGLFSSFTFTPTSKETTEKKSLFATLTPKTGEPVKEKPKSVEVNESFTTLSFSKDETIKSADNAVVKPSPIISGIIATKPATNQLQKQDETKTTDLNETSEEFVPTAEFKPVIPLPDLVDVKTGEENSDVMFESKAKLLRFDSSAKEWKERGIGQMKILKEKTIRLLMRREQVHKVCCNHQLLRAIDFSKMKTSPNVVSWCAMDFSEGVFATELFAVRFKNEQILNSFLDAIQKAKNMLDDNDNVKVSEAASEKKLRPVDTPTKPSNWSDKFKSTWECKTCFIVNEQKNSFCEACDSPRNENIQKKNQDAQFCFGVNQNTTSSASFSFAASKDNKGFGDAFKPKQGSWECKECYTRNDGDKTKCVSCDTTKDGSKPSEASKPASKGVDLSTGGLTFSFGIPAATPNPPTSTTGALFGAKTEKTSLDSSSFEISKDQKGFGDGFKAKEGSWECKECYIRNDGDKQKCVSCKNPNPNNSGLKLGFGMPTTASNTPSSTIGVKIEKASSTSEVSSTVKSGFGDAFKPKAGSWECKECYTINEGDRCVSCECPKDDTIPVKENKLKGVDLSTGGLKFSFGMPTSTIAATSFSFNTSVASPGENKGFSFSLNTTSKAEEKEEEIVFGSPHKAGFEFTPRSPRRQSGGHAPEEDSESSYYEEEEDNIYFKPVIPLPDKVEVTTGEEEEEQLYCHRAKLYRHVDGEWKERGIGEVKILYKADIKNLRVLMRREQVHKICLNHLLTKDIEYKPKDEKTWLFHAPDFSEGEIEHLMFCLRFKTGEIAADFKKAIEAALRKINNESVCDDDGDDSDVEIVYETEVTPEEEEEARKLGLPLKFMSYRQLPDCTCDQCKKEDEMLNASKSILKEKLTAPSIFKTVTTSTPFSSSFSFTSTSKPTGLLFGTPTTQGSTTSSMVFGGQAKATSVFGTPTTSSLFGTPTAASSVFGTPTAATSVFGTSTTTASSVFGTPSAPPSVFGTPITTASSVFGNPATTASSVFGTPSKTASSVFGTPATTASSVFGTPATTASSVFGTPATAASSVFGTPATTASSVFGTPVTTASIFGTPTTTSSLFGTPTTTSSVFGTPVTTASVFGKPTAASTLGGTGAAFSFGSSLFGKPAVATPTASSTSDGRMMGSAVSVTTGPIFGSSTVPSTTAGRIFNSNMVASTQSGPVFSSTTSSVVTKSIFGGNTSTTTSTPLFGSPAGTTIASGPIFGGARQSGPVFGSTGPQSNAAANVSQGNISVVPPTNTSFSFSSILQSDNKAKADDVFKTEISFSALASGAGSTGFISKSTNNDENPFASLGAGAPVFGSQVPKGTKPKHKDPANTSAENEDEDYDPQYEPIIPLPEAIVVTTGEEDEKVVFNERCKLYRFGNKEWKERGVGQIKVLYHPVNKTYRLLHRRDTVHKVVLNQLITADLEIHDFKMSSNAWTWSGMNFCENELLPENLAVKFKTEEQCQSFYKAVQEAIADISSIQDKSIPTTINYSYEEEDDVNEEEEEDADYDDEDDDERSILFRKKCSLSELAPNGQWVQVLDEGEFEVYYDPDAYASSISVVDNNGCVTSNTLIGTNTVMEQIPDENGTECKWGAYELAESNSQFRNLKVTFDDPEDAKACFLAYEESILIAKQSDIIDEKPDID